MRTDMAAALDKLKPYLGKPCTCTWLTEPDTRIRFIEWALLEDKQALLDRVFGSCDVPGDYAEVLGEQSGGIAWMSGKLVPVAFLGEQDGATDGQLDAIVVLDISKPAGTVYSIPVNGTALPQKKLTRVAASIEALKVVTNAANTPPRAPAPPKVVKPPKPKPAKAAKGAKAAPDAVKKP